MRNFIRQYRASAIVALCLVCFAVVCVMGIAMSRATKATQEEKKFKEFGQKRKLKQRLFDGLPLTIKKVKNLDAEEGEWFRTLEIEVENTSDKPIYFIFLVIEFPDIPAPTADAVTGFVLRYGDDRFGGVSEHAIPEDDPIVPGETHVFKIPLERAEGLENMKKRKKLSTEATKNITLDFQIISFGDGTGYHGYKYHDSNKKVSQCKPPNLQQHKVVQFVKARMNRLTTT